MLWTSSERLTLTTTDISLIKNLLSTSMKMKTLLISTSLTWSSTGVETMRTNLPSSASKMVSHRVDREVVQLVHKEDLNTQERVQTKRMLKIEHGESNSNLLSIL